MLPVIAAAALALTSAPAMAADSNHGINTSVAAEAQNLRIDMVSRNVPRPRNGRAWTADTACPTDTTPPLNPPQSGWYICGTTVLYNHWRDGRWEVFVVGIDHAIWHYFQLYNGDPNWSGWFSLGGYATDGVLPGHDPLSEVTIKVVGRDGNYWCDRSTPGSTPSGWSGFYRC
jgi:hypothetical protein